MPNRLQQTVLEAVIFAVMVIVLLMGTTAAHAQTTSQSQSQSAVDPRALALICGDRVEQERIPEICDRVPHPAKNAMNDNIPYEETIKIDDEAPQIRLNHGPTGACQHISNDRSIQFLCQGYRDALTVEQATIVYDDKGVHNVGCKDPKVIFASDLFVKIELVCHSLADKNSKK